MLAGTAFNIAPTANVTLYAVLDPEPDRYAVTYSGNNNTSAGAAPTGCQRLPQGAIVTVKTNSGESCPHAATHCELEHCGGWVRNDLTRLALTLRCRGAKYLRSTRSGTERWTYTVTYNANGGRCITCSG